VRAAVPLLLLHSCPVAGAAWGTGPAARLVLADGMPMDVSWGFTSRRAGFACTLWVRGDLPGGEWLL